MLTNGMFVQAQYSTNTMFTSMELTKVLFVFAENFRKRCLMGFKDRLREKRVEANLTQAALAEKVSVTARTIQNYELGSRKPTKYEVVKKIAEALNTTPEYLLGNSGMLVLAAQEQGGAKAAREIDELVSEVSGMFAGGSLSEDALDGAMQALTRAYWIAKEKNKKYTPKKYRKEQTEDDMIPKK